MKETIQLWEYYEIEGILDVVRKLADISYKEEIMKRIFTIESDWEGSAKKQGSILPMLQCINVIYPSVKYIFRTANTKEELRYCLTKFKQMSRKNGDYCAFFLSLV